MKKLIDKVYEEVACLIIHNALIDNTSGERLKANLESLKNRADEIKRLLDDDNFPEHP